MTVTKNELIEINDKLRVNIRQAEEENARLQETNESLTRRCTELQSQVESTEEELARLNRRYQSFADYAKRLRAWMLTRRTSDHREE